MGNPAISFGDRFTYADILRWDESERWELINGQAFRMAAPSPQHQRVSRKILRQLAALFDRNPCEVFYAPIDVVLGPKQKDDREKRDVVQPDLVIVCDEKKVTPRAIEGTPDMVVEIVSPTSIKRDFNDKFLLFEQFQVPVYWIVVLEQQLVYVFEWDQKSKSLRETGQYGPQDSAPVSIVQGGQIDLSEIFTE